MIIKTLFHPSQNVMVPLKELSRRGIWGCSKSKFTKEVAQSQLHLYITVGEE